MSQIVTHKREQRIVSAIKQTKVLRLMLPTRQPSRAINGPLLKTLFSTKNVILCQLFLPLVISISECPVTTFNKL